MAALPSRQEAVADELREWWEDSWQRGIGPRVLLLKAPPGWGRCSVLARIAEIIDSDDAAPVTIVIPIRARDLLDGKGSQAEEIRRRLSEPNRAAELLDVDRPAGIFQLAVEAGAVFSPTPRVAAGALLADKTIGVLRKLWEDSTAGQADALARAARAVSRVSVQVPVVVLIDDADRLDVDLVVTLLENLAFRADGKMLAVVAAAKDSELAAALRAGHRPALAGLVAVIEPDTDMSSAARAELARERRPGLPETAIRRIGQRTGTFCDVLRVTDSERLAEIGPGAVQPDTLTVVDAVIDRTLKRGEPSAEAIMVAWAGGLAHARQAAAALAARGEESLDDDPDLTRSGPLVRLADDPGSPRISAPVIALTGAERRSMVAAVLEEAASIYTDKLSGLVDRVAAGRAAHHVRDDVSEDQAVRLLQVQRALTADLEAVGDLAAAGKIAAEAFKGCPPGARYKRDRRKLKETVLRLASARPADDQDPVVAELTREAVAGGAAIALEARVWAAANLLGMAGGSTAALRLIDQITAELDSRDNLGDSQVNWRLLLACRAGKARVPSAAQRLLAPLLASSDTALKDAAVKVLRVISDPYAGVRLQIETLEAELQAAQSDDDLLRLHAALSSAYGEVGDYRRARDHARLEVPLRQNLQGPEHPATLFARANLADWTGKAGNPAAARDQYTALLPVVERVLGPGNPDTLTTSANLATWTGEAGNPPAARDRYAALLPVIERALGPDNAQTLAARRNLAYWTGVAGDWAAARDQFAALLPGYERVFGPDHPDTLTARGNLASWTGSAGNKAAARDQYTALLPSFERVFGADHPETLTTRGNIANWTGEAGDRAAARDQFAALLPVEERVLGRGHPNTLTTRRHLANMTGAAGDPAAARDLLAALLPDMARVLGPEFPETQFARHELEFWTQNVKRSR